MSPALAAEHRGQRADIFRLTITCLCYYVKMCNRKYFFQNLQCSVKKIVAIGAPKYLVSSLTQVHCNAKLITQATDFERFSPLL